MLLLVGSVQKHTSIIHRQTQTIWSLWLTKQKKFLPQFTLNNLKKSDLIRTSETRQIISMNDCGTCPCSNMASGTSHECHNRCSFQPSICVIVSIVSTRAAFFPTSTPNFPLPITISTSRHRLQSFFVSVKQLIDITVVVLACQVADLQLLQCRCQLTASYTAIASQLGSMSIFFTYFAHIILDYYLTAAALIMG